MEDKKRKKRIDTLVVTFALFSAIFGAGSLIFPPKLGLVAGTQWPVALIAFLISGVVLPFIGVLAVSNFDGTAEGIGYYLGSTQSKIIIGIVMFVGGGIVVTPRTSATSFELGIEPLFHASSNTARWIFAVIYFGIVLYFAFNPSSVIDKIGKYLTPLLIVMMFLIVIKAIFDPIAAPADTGAVGVFSSSFLGGYQTLDVLGSITVAGVMINAVEDKGYSLSGGEGRSVMRHVTLYAGIGMAILLGGLLFLGGQGSGLFPVDMDNTALVIALIGEQWGRAGNVILGIAILLACITTAVGCVSAISDYTSRLTNGKIPYKALVIIMCVLAVPMSVLGVAKILSVTGPLVDIIYPTVIILVVLGTFVNLIPESIRKGVYRGSIYTALAISILGGISAYGINIQAIQSMLNALPLYSQGFGWLIPSVLVGAICAVVENSKNKKDAA